MQEKIKELLENHCIQIPVYTPNTISGEVHCADCPKKKDGLCHRCDQFMGYLTKDPGGVLKTYETCYGFCLNEGEDRTEVITELNQLLADYEIQQVLEAAETGGQH